MDKWDEDTLGSLRIHELRDLARKIGVKCPTALKKEDIIEQAMSILKGETQPNTPSKKGRPTKSSNNVQKLVEFFMPDNSNLNSDVDYKPYDFDSELYVNMPQIQFDNQDNIEEVDGLVEITDSGNGILRINQFGTDENDIYIHDMIVNKYALKTGDFIRANAKIVMPNRPRIVTSVLSINQNIVPTSKTDSINILGKTYGVGDNALILNSDNTNMAMETFDYLSDDQLNIYVSAYDKSKHNSTISKIYATVTPFASYNGIYCCYNMAFHRAKVLSANAQVILVINSLTSFYRSLSSIMCDKIDNSIKLNKAVQEKILALLKMAKDHNITVLIYDNLECEQNIKDYMLYELKNIVDHFEMK